MTLIRYFILIFTVFFYSHSVDASVDGFSSDRDIFVSGLEFFHETSETALSLRQATRYFNDGISTPAERSFLTFGINKQATWVHLSLTNLTHKVLTRRLTAGMTWIENVDVYLVNQSNIDQHWHSGDGQTADIHLLPEIGVVFDVSLLPGKNDIFIRGETLDPLTMPIELLNSHDAGLSDAKKHVASGFLYGILLALVGYNILLYISLKQSDALYYAMYISCFVIMNFGYSGYAFSWIYPNSPVIQNYSTLFFMVLHGVCGLIFASNFLLLPVRMPFLFSTLRIYILSSIAAMTLFTVMQNHLWASYFSFSFLSVTTLIMIIVGIMNLGKQKESQYFLLAVLCSMTGLLITTLSVCGIIPYTYYGFNSAAYGVVLEAIILAVILAKRLKDIESDRKSANYLSSHDPLLKLFNRRFFEKEANKIVQSNIHHEKSVSFLIMDIDHFKVVNDTYGHHVGDLALCHIADLIRNHTREKDIVARWGGKKL